MNVSIEREQSQKQTQDTRQSDVQIIRYSDIQTVRKSDNLKIRKSGTRDQEPQTGNGRVSFWYSIFFLLIVFLFQACYFDVVINETPDTSEAVSFSKDLVPVFRASCVSCHDGQTAQPDFSSSVLYTSLSTGNYLSVTDPENSTLITKIRSDHPYAGAVTEIEIQKLIRWMKEGAANN
ncbi:MAG: hypothetical protein AB2L24_04990 [Mangrovibacterium sp.]